MSSLHAWMKLPDGTFLRKNLTTHRLEIYAADGTTLLRSIPGLNARAYYEHSSVTGTHPAGTKATFVLLADRDNTAGDISLNGPTTGVVLAANTGFYKVTVFADTEAPQFGDTTTCQVLVNGVTYSNFNVSVVNHVTGSWFDLIDTTGAAVTVEVNRGSVTGTGRLDIKMNVEALD